MAKPYLNLSLGTNYTEKELVHIRDTEDHVGKVRTNMMKIQGALATRASVHDASKIQEPELTAFAVYGAKLSELKYGSDEYFKQLNDEKFQIGIKHHYANNTHHPEYYPNGILGMSLLDVLEMMADWKAAGERTKDGNFQSSLEYNRKRFNIPDELFIMMEKTAKELGWI